MLTSQGMIAAFGQIVKNEGAGALLTGIGPTFAGYFLQGGFKFGGYELFKKLIVEQIGMEKARENRMPVYLGASALAEFFADIALCPLEATRIRLVSQPSFASGLLPGFARILREEGVGAFYAGFGPILLKQVPYNMAKFATMEITLEVRLTSFVTSMPFGLAADGGEARRGKATTPSRSRSSPRRSRRLRLPPYPPTTKPGTPRTTARTRRG